MARRNRRRRTSKRRTIRKKSLLDFQPLEPRRLLASLGSTLPAGTNMITNGQFNSKAGATPAPFGMFDADDVNGWQVSQAGQSINLLSINVGSRGEVLDLDSESNRFDRVFQDIATQEGTEYILAFDLRQREADGSAPTPAATTNDVEVFWGGNNLGVFRGINHWQTITLSVTGLTGDISQLSFRELSEAGSGGSHGSDGRGPLIDNVRLVNISEASLENGGFETVANAGNSIHETNDVAGWNAMGDSGDRFLEVVTSAESRTGERHLNLDSTDTRLDRIYQDVNTVNGMSYYVTFDLKSASGQSDGDNEVRVRWGDKWVGTFNGGAEWESHGVLVNADSAETRLVFREPATGTNDAGDGTGPLIDNVRIVSIDPAASSMIVDTNGSTAGVDSTVSYSEGDGAKLIVTSELTVTAGTSELDGATVTLPSVTATESLAVDTTDTSISASFDSVTGVLTLSGTASVADYQKVLRTLQYTETSDNPAASRVVDIAVRTADVMSDSASVTINFTSTNDPPVVDSISDVADHTLGTSFSLDVVANDPENEALSYSIEFTGDAVGGTSSVPVISSDGKITWTPEREGLLSITVTVEDATGAKTLESFDIDVVRNAAVPSDFTPFSGTGALSNVTPALRNSIYNSAPTMNIDTAKTYQAVITTNDGDIVLDLFDNDSPITVNNFVNLARDGFYDGVGFHRVIPLSADGDIAQGGDPAGTGSGGPGYQFEDEVDNGLAMDRRGLIAMANAGADTNGSQFFLTLGAQNHLTGRHTIFGEVVQGDALLDQITKRNPSQANPPAPEIIQSIRIIES